MQRWENNDSNIYNLSKILVDERKDVFEIDYETFFNKQVLDQLDEFNKIEDVKNLVETYRKDAKSDK